VSQDAGDSGTGTVGGFAAATHNAAAAASMVWNVERKGKDRVIWLEGLGTKFAAIVNKLGRPVGRSL